MRATALRHILAKDHPPGQREQATDCHAEKSILAHPSSLQNSVALPFTSKFTFRGLIKNTHHGRSIREFMSSSKRPYGFTCSQISGVRAA